MQLRTRPSLVQAMAWCLFGAKSLPASMITYFQKALDDHIMDKINNVDFKEMEMHSKCRLQRSGHFVPTLTFQTH